jgi:hypothetical protein
MRRVMRGRQRVQREEGGDGELEMVVREISMSYDFVDASDSPYGINHVMAINHAPSIVQAASCKSKILALLYNLFLKLQT